MATMKAIRYYGPQDIRVEEVDVPQCGDNEIRVKVDACAVCGTDLKAYKSGNPRIKPPQIMGHEFTGLVDIVGSDVTGFADGDRVVMATSVSCGQCAYCDQGNPNLCVDVAPMGFTYAGGMAEWVVIPNRALANGHVIKVPETVKPEHAALAEPVSCAVNSIENSVIRPGDVVVVIGAGPMGIINGCVAKQQGAAKIILAEINPDRLRQGAAFGFDQLVDPANQDLQQIVMDETDGLGANVVIVAAPAAPPQEQAPALVRKRGTVCLFASLPVGGHLLSMDSRAIHYNEIRVVGTSDSTPAHVEAAVDMISQGTIPVEKLASHILPMDDVMLAFELMQSGEALRVVLKP
ncbi:MAG: alcohol dehydrogenase catalytic domain-containing protein [Phycisphaeraceae bacterium]|nr:alcohol dehydrogenase catalytic domain-containing protein [Phycisphaeraceae bacterium]